MDELVSLRANGVEPPNLNEQPIITDLEIDTYKEQERFLPIANIGRLMKKCLPNSTKVSKDAKEIVQECTSEFISFITAEAAEKCEHEKRKTINGEDILAALNTLGFENYEGALRIYLSKYRDQAASTGKRVVKGVNKRKPEDLISDRSAPGVAKVEVDSKEPEEDDYEEMSDEEDE